ncbi:MAG TPA: SH3 domain-containing protein [Methylomirabilota bacterium]|nr:SH3 domain-containing protein [Methylomirabilota bacterium]
MMSKIVVKTVMTVALSLGGSLLLIATADPADFVRVKVEAANVRNGPGTENDRVLQANENEPLQVISRRDTWLKVRTYDGHQGWIFEALTDDKPAVVVTGTTVNMRAGPGTDHEVTYTTERGTCFLVLGHRGAWLDVRHESGDRGWIHGSLVWGN